MKISQNLLFILLVTSSFTTHINSSQAQQNTSLFNKKLKKIWQNYWVKAGTVTAACAMLYALGIQLNIITPALLCTGTAECNLCHKQKNPIIAPNNQLLWKAMGIIGGLGACAFGYAYFNTQNNNDDVSEENSTGEEIELNDTFFEFADEQMDMDDEFIVSSMSTHENESTENKQPSDFSDETPLDVAVDQTDNQDDEIVLPESTAAKSFLANASSK